MNRPRARHTRRTDAAHAEVALAGRKSGRGLGGLLLVVTLATLFVTFAHQPAGASALLESKQDQVQAWLQENGDRTVKEILLPDTQWAGELGLTANSHVSFGAAHRYLVIGAPDYDLKTDEVRGDLSIQAHIMSESDYCAPVTIDNETVDLVLCVTVTDAGIDMTSLGQMGFTDAIAGISANADFINDGPFGIYAHEGGSVFPLNDTAEYHVPEPTPAAVFMQARAKQAAELKAVSGNSAEDLILGTGPSLLNPDPDELHEWNQMVAAGLEREQEWVQAPDQETAESSQNPWRMTLVIGGGLVAVGLIAALLITAVRARAERAQAKGAQDKAGHAAGSDVSES